MYICNIIFYKGFKCIYINRIVYRTIELNIRMFRFDTFKLRVSKVLHLNDHAKSNPIEELDEILNRLFVNYSVCFHPYP